MSKKGRLLEPHAAKRGALFYGVLTYLHQTPEHPKAELINNDFANNRTVVAQMSPFRCERYRDLPVDVKSFVSRCASHKRYSPRMTMEQIVREQHALVVHDSNRLYHEVMNLMEQGLREMKWQRMREEALSEWHENAARDPLHAYHPEEIPDEYLKTNLFVYG